MRADSRVELVKFLSTHDPKKVSDVDALLARYVSPETSAFPDQDGGLGDFRRFVSNERAMYGGDGFFLHDLVTFGE